MDKNQTLHRLVDKVGTLHPAYTSMNKVVHEVAREMMLDYSVETKADFVLSTKSKMVSYSKLNPDPKAIYLMHSPLISMTDFEGLIRKSRLLIHEEYQPTGGKRDVVASRVLRLFGSKIFLSSTKRTHSFLERLSLCSILIPPACEERLATNERDFYLFVGKMIPSKNPEFVLKLARAMPEEKFVMIGAGPLFELIMQTKPKNVALLANVESPFWYYTRAKALIHPALKDPIGFVVVEALSCGTPVICSNGAGASDYLPPEWVMSTFNLSGWEFALKCADGKAGLVKAKQVFKRGHLDINDSYFTEIAKTLAGMIA